MARTKTNTQNDTKNTYNIMTQHTLRKKLFFLKATDRKEALDVIHYFNIKAASRDNVKFDFYAPRKISGEHIVAAPVRPSVRPSVSASVRPYVPFVSGP